MKNILILALILFLTGCSSATYKYKISDFSNDRSVYFTLEKNDLEEWRITQVTLTPRDATSNSMSVSVNSGQAIGLYTREESCWSSMWTGFREGDDDSCTEGHFRDYRWTPKSYFNYMVGGVFSFGIFWLIGEAPVEGFFDQDAFEYAVNNAIEKSGLKPEDIRLIADRLSEVQGLMQKNLNVCSDIEGLGGKLTSKYQESFKKAASQYLKKVVSNVVVEDKSGLLKNKKDFKKRVQIDGSITPPDYVVSEGLYVDCSKLKQPISEFDLVGMNNLESWYKGVISTPRNIEEELHLKRALYAKESSLIEAQVYSAMNSGEGYVNISCSGGKVEAGFYYESSCPYFNKISDVVLNKNAPLLFSVLYKEHSHPFPFSYFNSDNNLEIRFDGENIVISNLTGSYIDIKKLSLYYNNKILTKYNVGGSFMELPPKAFGDIRIREFNLTDMGDQYGKIKSNSKINFGISAQYDISGNSYSLHATKSYSAADIL